MTAPPDKTSPPRDGGTDPSDNATPRSSEAQSDTSQVQPQGRDDEPTEILLQSDTRDPTQNGDNGFTRLQGVLYRLFRPIEFSLLIIGLIIATVTFQFETEDRRNQRIVNAWQLALEKAPGGGGKVRALEWLYKSEESMFGLDMSFVAHGSPVFLHKLDMYDEATKRGASLPNSSFAGALLLHADLRNADFRNSCFYYANLQSAKLDNADLSYADLNCAILPEAVLTGADLTNANLSSTYLQNVIGLTQEQIDAAFFCDEDGVAPILPPKLKPPPKRKCAKAIPEREFTTAKGCLWSGVRRTDRARIRCAR